MGSDRITFKTGLRLFRSVTIIICFDTFGAIDLANHAASSISSMRKNFSMKFVFGILLAIVTAVAAILAQTGISKPLLGTVARLSDVNKVVLRVSTGEEFEMCLRAIDVPREGELFAEVSRSHIERTLIGKEITVHPDGAITVAGVDVSAQFLRDGAAWFNSEVCGTVTGETYQFYRNQEATARAERRGVWSDSEFDPWTATSARLLRASRKEEPSHPSPSTQAARKPRVQGTPRPVYDITNWPFWPTPTPVPQGGSSGDSDSSYSGYGSGGSDSRGGPVRVRSYYRRNGTFVRSHTRSAPRRR